MSSGIYVALSGAVANSQALDVVANNVANANTTGYKAERVNFAEALAGKGGAAARADSHFVKVAGTTSDPTPGIINTTDNPLDVAIEGEGYLAVGTAAGTRYTRAGQLRINNEGALTSADGNSVLDTNGKPILTPKSAASIEIASDGTVRADGKSIGQMKLSRLDPKKLQRAGANLFTGVEVPNPAGKPVTLIPNAYESANVSAVRGMVDLVRVSRTYDALHRMLETYKDLDDRAARSIGGTG